MVENKIEILITNVKTEVAEPYAVGFKVKIRNNIDNIRIWRDHNSDNIPGYLDKSELIGILESVQKKLKETVIENTPDINIKIGERWE